MKKTCIIILLFIFSSGCGDLFVENPPAPDNLMLFESVSQHLKDNYPFFEYKNIDWNLLYSKYRVQAEKSKGDEIIKIIYDMLREFKDAQIEIFTEGGYPIITYLWPGESDSKSFSPEVVRKYFNKPLKLSGNDRIEYEILPDNIGYVHFTTFEKGNWVYDFDQIMNYFSGTDGIIIDVRNNIGGRTVMTDHIISYFIDQPLTGYVFDKDGNASSWIIEPKSGNRYSNPAAVLINGASYSATEVFADMMKYAPDTRIIGTTTGGGGGSTKEFDLPGGRSMRLPTAYFKQLDGTMIEWNGVKPDSIVFQTQQDINNGTDPQLETAIGLLKKNK